jgi:FMN phosphatase YigB (HAD superfamily)
VPVGDLRLAQLPAEQHVFVTAPGRKVDEAGVEVLHHGTEPLDSANAAGHRRGLLLDGLRELGKVTRRHPATVSGNRRQRLGAPGVSGRERAAVLDHLLHERPHLGERPIRLLGCEEARRHPGMIVGLVSGGQRQGVASAALAGIDAVTIDGYGTLLTLRDPIGHLDRELRARGVEQPAAEVRRGFEAEVRYYKREKISGRDPAGVAALRAGCAGAVLDELGLDLDRNEFASAFAFSFDVLPGVHDALAGLAARGLALAVVADWDYSLHDQLREHGLERRFAAVVLSAELGRAKPDPAPFRAALEQLGVEPARALHVGDSEVDEQGAAAAGMRFAPAPLVRLLDPA